MSFIDRKEILGTDKRQVDNWIQSEKNCVVLEHGSNVGYQIPNNSFKFSRLIGLGIKEQIECVDESSLSELREWLSDANDFVFGYFSYDLKNQLENLSSTGVDSFDSPSFRFFIPQTVVIDKGDSHRVLTHGIETGSCHSIETEEVKIGPSLGAVSKPDYIGKVNKLKAHIQQGDIYEVNYCVQHGFTDTVVDPVRLFDELKSASEAPFACFLAIEGNYLMSASPERFMKKIGNRIFSQPMKGTNRRSVDNESQKSRLRSDSKEIAENVMITDLVRNDLSRSANKGTVEVDELCGVYEFPQVNQMISTVSAELREDLHPLDAILNAFPMGSMTGAPKISAMNLIDEVEDFSRGLFSGAVGYFTPELNFDFNVVIRSFIYNKEKELVTFPTGGAITINSDPNKEFEECLLKAEILKSVLLDHAREI